MATMAKVNDATHQFQGLGCAVLTSATGLESMKMPVFFGVLACIL